MIDLLVLYCFWSYISSFEFIGNSVQICWIWVAKCSSGWWGLMMNTWPHYGVILTSRKRSTNHKCMSSFKCFHKHFKYDETFWWCWQKCHPLSSIKMLSICLNTIFNSILYLYSSKSFESRKRAIVLLPRHNTVWHTSYSDSICRLTNCASYELSLGTFQLVI